MTGRLPRARVWICLVLTLFLISTTASGAFALENATDSAASTPGTLTTLTTTNETDSNGNGVYGNFDLYIEGDSRLPAGNDDGDGIAEPILRVYINGEETYSGIEVENTQDLAGSIPIPKAELPARDDPALNVTVVLLDEDPLLDDVLDTRTTTVPYEVNESSLQVALSRSSTPAGSPVYFQMSAGNPPYTVSTTEAPDGASPSLRAQNSDVIGVRAAVPGEYTFRVSDESGTTQTSRLTVTDRSDLIDRYAPRIHLAAGEQYRPTRYEAFVENAQLVDQSGLGTSTLVSDPSMVDLKQYAGSPVMDLLGEERDFQTYDDTYPPTVYASVDESVSYNGNSYTGITYWLFYVYDPKTGGLDTFLAHEGDLETVSVLVNQSGPQWVAASQHYGGEIREWEYAPTEGTHLEVYPALGAHSNYLVNTDSFDGDGLLGQDQFANLGGPDPLLGDTYTDTTGNATMFAPPDSGGNGYEIVPLDGTEAWAEFNGGFDDAPDKGQIPMQRQRWAAQGSWAEENLYADELQRNATIEAFSASYDDTGSGNVTVSTALENTGLKPTALTLEAVAKPSGQSWASQNTTVLSSEQVRLGTNTQQSVSFDGSPATAVVGTWDVRLRVGLYETPVVPSTRVAVSDTAPSVYDVERVVVAEKPAQNLDDDPLLEDVNGDGVGNVFDALTYYRNRDSDAISQNPALFDFDGDGEAGTIFDAISLYEQL